MLKQKADPSQVNAKGKTPLDLAQTSQSPAVVKLLEKFGATRNCSSETDRRVMRCLRVGPSEEVEPRPVFPGTHVFAGEFIYRFVVYPSFVPCPAATQKSPDQT